MRAIILLTLCLFVIALPLLASPDTLATVNLSDSLLTGCKPTLAAATDDTLMVMYADNLFIELANTGDEKTATLISQVSDWETLPAGVAASNLAITVLATTGNTLIGPFRQRSWADKTTGYIMVVLSSETDVTVGPFKTGN